MTTLMPIHSAAMFHVVHVRSRMEVGARSRFQRGLDETSSLNSTKSRCVSALSRLEVSGLIFSFEAIGLVEVLIENEARRNLRRYGYEAGGECGPLLIRLAFVCNGGEVL